MNEAKLRSIAVTVEETTPGAFVWVLLERSLEWEPLERGHRATDSYAKAMADGLVALQAMVEDLKAGPREVATEAAVVKHAAFGFGFGGLK